MKCNEIIAFLEKQYPSKYALDWDNVGLLIGKSDSDMLRLMRMMTLSKMLFVIMQI